MIDAGRSLPVNLSRRTAPPARAQCCLFSLPRFLSGRVYLDSVAPFLCGIGTN